MIVFPNRYRVLNQPLFNLNGQLLRPSQWATGVYIKHSLEVLFSLNFYHLKISRSSAIGLGYAGSKLAPCNHCGLDAPRCPHSWYHSFSADSFVLVMHSNVVEFIAVDASQCQRRTANKLLNSSTICLSPRFIVSLAVFWTYTFRYLWKNWKCIIASGKLSNTSSEATCLFCK